MGMAQLESKKLEADRLNCPTRTKALWLRFAKLPYWRVLHPPSGAVPDCSCGRRFARIVATGVIETPAMQKKHGRGLVF
jgi:hypothetical protein